MMGGRPAFAHTAQATKFRGESDTTASTTFSLDVDNTLTNYARSKILSISEDSLKLILKRELEKYNARMKCGTFFSLSFSFLLAGFSTLDIKFNFWKQEFTVSTIFFLFTLIALAFAIRKVLICWKAIFAYDFVDSVFQTIEQTYSSKTQKQASDFGDFDPMMALKFMRH